MGDGKRVLNGDAVVKIGDAPVTDDGDEDAGVRDVARGTATGGVHGFVVAAFLSPAGDDVGTARGDDTGCDDVGVDFVVVLAVAAANDGDDDDDSARMTRR